MTLLYFAFGSNLSQKRLEARVGSVERVGAALLRDFSHRFDHYGQDGSAKGNIVVDNTQAVWGVLYLLSPEQLRILSPYELGYERRNIVVTPRTGPRRSALTFMSYARRRGLRPTAAYFHHYRVGMRENQFPEHYRRFIERQARL